MLDERQVAELIGPAAYRPASWAKHDGQARDDGEAKDVGQVKGERQAKDERQAKGDGQTKTSGQTNNAGAWIMLREYDISIACGGARHDLARTHYD